MRKWSLVFYLVLIACLQAEASRGGTPTWVRNYEMMYGGLAATADGGFYLAVKDPPIGPSSTNSCSLLKVDALGAIQSRTPFGRRSHFPIEVITAPDGGAVVGLVPFGGPGDSMVIQKLLGSSQWMVTASVPDVSGVLGDVAADGSVLVGGTVSTRPFVAKLGATGAMVWSTVLDTAPSGIGSVRFLVDGSVLASGGTWSPCRYWIAKLDPAGTPLWRKSYDEPGFVVTAAEIVATADRGALIAGTQRDATTCEVVAGSLLRVDGAGAVLWRKVYSDAGQVTFSHLEPTSDGGFLVNGMTDATSSSPGVLLKVDAAGVILWQLEPTSGDYGLAVSTAGDVVVMGDFVASVSGDGTGLPCSSPTYLSAAVAALTPSSLTTSTAPGPDFVAAVIDADDFSPVQMVLCASDCLGAPGPIAGLMAAKGTFDPSGLLLSWSSDPAALGYDLWYVSDKADIDRARQASAPPALGIPSCVNPVNRFRPFWPTECFDDGGVVRPPALAFYQVRAYCNSAHEGP